MVSNKKSMVVPATYAALNAFTREDLREYARDIGVERGQNKDDTIQNLLKSRKAKLVAFLYI